jgi:hypothetical protein
MIDFISRWRIKLFRNRVDCNFKRSTDQQLHGVLKQCASGRALEVLEVIENTDRLRRGLQQPDIDIRDGVPRRLGKFCLK